jgi:hypothetical protein
MNIDPNPDNSKSQAAEVLRFLKSGGRLTSLDAINLWGITRLAARVHELRQRGEPIESIKIPVRNRNGRMVRVEVYWFGRAA